MTTAHTRSAGGSGTGTWPAIIAVGAGTFTLVTSELLPVGLLTQIGEDLAASERTTGTLVMAPGLVAAIAAPLTAKLSSRFDHRRLLCLFMASLVFANTTSALATGLGVLVTARIVVGLSIGGFWTLAGGLATRLVGADRLGAATAVVFGGVSVASVAGMPLSTVLGDALGWRVAFAVVAAFGVAVLLALLRWVPQLPPAGTPSGVLPALRIRAVRVGVVVTFFLVAGHFAAYTYASPLLQSLTGVSEATVGPLLIVFGASGLLANMLVAGRAPTHPGVTLGVVAAFLAGVLLVLPAVSVGWPAAIFVVVVWGLAYGGVSVACQTWMIRAAPHTVEGATASLVSAFNLAIAFGALLGGSVVDRMPVHRTAWAGSALAILAVVALLNGSGSRPHRCLDNALDNVPSPTDRMDNRCTPPPQDTSPSAS